jgi:Tol biopolymer transport system component
LRHAGDARLELIDDESESDDHGLARPAGVNARTAALIALPLALVIGAAAYYAGRSTGSTADLPLRKWTVPLEYGETDAIWFRENAPAISPDGVRVAYVDGPKLRIRSLGALDDRDIAAAAVPAWPTWSADGSALAYVTGHRTLWKVPITEGTPAKICDLPQGVVLGVAWRRDKTILVNVAYGPHGAEIFSVPDTGGTPQRRAIPGVPEGKTPIVFDLHGLPDGSIAYTKAGASGLTTILERDGQEPRTLAIPANWGVVYSPSGHLLFARRDTPGIFAVVFEAGTATVVGQPFRIIENGMSPSVSADGTLAYLRLVPGSRQLAWLDRSGNVISAIGQAQDSMWDPSISPDGTRVAVAGVEDGTPEIWTHDTARRAKNRLTISGIALGPAWHPTERRIVFQTGGWDLSSVSADGGDPNSVVQSPDPEFNPLWSRDGKFLLFGRNVQKTGADLWVLEQGARDPKPVLATAFNELDATMSPDGTYIAYASDETGKLEVFVRTFPAAQDKTQISFATGHSARWSPKGNEIFYVEGHRLMTATVKTSPKFSADPPKPLFDLEDRAGDVRVYDTADGQRFAVVRTLRPPRNGVVVVQNWIKEFAGR